jgi:hypothetical protein
MFRRSWPSLWNRYLRYLRGRGSHASSPEPASAAAAEPVRGIWAADLPGFLTWINGLSDDGPACRLPTCAELDQLSAWTKAADGTVWTYVEEGGYSLYQPLGIPHPHSPTLAHRLMYPGLIIDRTCLLLHLATNTELRLSRLLLYGYLATCGNLPSRPEYELLRALDFLATINATRSLYRDRHSSRDIVFDDAYDNFLTRAHTLDHAIDPVLPPEFSLDLGSPRDIEPTLAFARNRVSARILDLAGDFDLGLRSDVRGRTVLFIGYRGRDLDFQPIWDQVLSDAAAVVWFDRWADGNMSDARFKRHCREIGCPPNRPSRACWGTTRVHGLATGTQPETLGTLGKPPVGWRFPMSTTVAMPWPHC